MLANSCRPIGQRGLANRSRSSRRKNAAGVQAGGESRDERVRVDTASMNA
jgi:hypothetical protein